MGADALPPRVDRVLHVVCDEEAGNCTLARIASDAREGDAVVYLGASSRAARLRRLGLANAVELAVAPWSGLPGLFRRPRIAACGALARGRRALAHGPRAAAEWARVHGIAERAAPPAELPRSEPWPEGRRARVRRELGLAPTECAVLVAADCPEWIDLGLPMHAFMMARAAGARLRIVVSPSVPRHARHAERYRLAVGGGDLIVDPRAETPWELLPAMDAMLLDVDGAGTAPADCLGRRRLTAGVMLSQPSSALPALWGIAANTTVLAHESIDLGVHTAHPLVRRFTREVDGLARALFACHAAVVGGSSAMAASR